MLLVTAKRITFSNEAREAKQSKAREEELDDVIIVFLLLLLLFRSIRCCSLQSLLHRLSVSKEKLLIIYRQHPLIMTGEGEKGEKKRKERKKRNYFFKNNHDDDVTAVISMTTLSFHIND